MAMAVVDPATVGSPVIVADVEVGSAVAVDVAEGCGEPPVGWGLGERGAILVEERASGPGDRVEVAGAVIEVELVWLAALLEAAIQQDESVGLGPAQHRAAVDHLHVHPAAVTDVVGAVVCDVEIEGSVAVDVSEGERGRAGACGGAGGGGGIGEFPVAIVEEAEDAATGHGHQEVEMTVAIDVCEDGAAGGGQRFGEPGGAGDVLEAEVAEIAVERVMAGQVAEEDVGPAVAVEVAGGDTCAVVEDAIRGAGEFVEDVGEGDPGGCGGDGGEADGIAGGGGEFEGPESGAGFPLSGGAWGECGGAQQGEQRDGSGRGSETVGGTAVSGLFEKGTRAGTLNRSGRARTPLRAGLARLTFG